jgi:hypothetical protein
VAVYHLVGLRKGACRNGEAQLRHPTEHLNIALINNMPDAALEDTELQFFDLLDEASGDLPIYLKLYSLTGIPRTDRGQRHLNSFYYSLDELWQNQFDGVIVTGTEPRQPNLRDEPYWKVLADVFDWAERNTVPRYFLVWRRTPACFTATASPVTACPTNSLAYLTSPRKTAIRYLSARQSVCVFRIPDGTRCKPMHLAILVISF